MEILHSADKKLELSFGFQLLIILISSIHPVFSHLDSYPLLLWDESRLANTAFEMSQSGNYFVTTFDGNPDMWSTKPPMMIWLQVFFIKWIGVNEIAIRLPTSFAVFFNCILLFLFCEKYLKLKYLGLFSALILMTSSGFMFYHTGRTGDYDALLTLWITGYILSFYIYFDKFDLPYWYLGCLFLVLAGYTKGIQAFIPLPAFLFLLISDGKLFRKFVRSYHSYLGIGLVVGLVGLYYFLREQITPGYIHQVFQNEWGGRYLTTLEGHLYPFNFYFDELWVTKFYFWKFPFLLSLLVLIFKSSGYNRRFFLFIFCSGFFYLMVLSFSSTKLPWYDAPVYPILAIISALFCSFVFSKIESFGSNIRFKNLLMILILVFIIYFPYSKVSGFISRGKETVSKNKDMQVSYLMSTLNDSLKTNSIKIDKSIYNQQVLFYIRKYNMEGTKFQVSDRNDLSKGDIFIYQSSIPISQDEISKKYEIDKIQNFEETYLLKVNCVVD